MNKTHNDHHADRVDALGRSFTLLNWTQFQGALNDNIFKLLVTFFLIRTFGSEQASMLTGLGGIIFALPFILFVPAAGVLADRFSKTRITVFAKVAEIVVMSTGCLMFWLGNPWLGFAVLFLMSTQSAFFGPTKYGIIPELVEPHQLSRANGYLVSLTYLSIILGTVCAPLLTDHLVGPDASDNSGARFALAALVCVAIAVTGALTSLGIRRTPPAGSSATVSIRFWRDVVRTFRSIRDDRFLVLAILAASYFSLIGAFIQLNLIPFSIHHLGISETAGGLLFLYAAFGIGAGSLLAGRLSGRNIEFGIIPVGAILIALSAMLLFLLPYSVMATRVLMFTAGMGAGLFIIPLEAFIQFRAPRDKLGEVLAANGFLSWLGVLGAGILVFGLSFVPFWQPSYTFAVLGLLTLAMTAVCLKVLPDFFVRFVAMVITRSVYRIRTIGLDHLPVQGGGLIVANHVSYTDALLILASQQRRIRFLMLRSIYETHPLRMIFRLMGVIPIAAEDHPRKLVASLQEARRQIAEGYLVCIFAEGMLTRNGQMQGFKPGMERIARDAGCPIYPLYLGGIWGSRFSYYRTLFRKAKAPLRWRYPVRIVIGDPMPPEAPAWLVQQRIRELSAEHFDARKGPHRSVVHGFITTARRHWRRTAVRDTTGAELTYGRALVAVILFASRIRRLAPRSALKSIGIALPPTVGGALCNLAAAMTGRVAVNLNFTASPAAFQSALDQAEVDTVITSRKLVARVKGVPWPDNLVYIEDVIKSIRTIDRVTALLKALVWPVRLLAPRLHDHGDDLLTIMFSSGTTGQPKGVMLSHHNILSNSEAIADVFRPDPDAHLCATLPLFHSFGYTAGIFFPLLNGLEVSYHTSPLDTGTVVDLIASRRCNTLFTTPSFLQSYLKKAEPGALSSLAFVVVGAEKLKPQLADAFEERFGVRPLEGYGTTEMSPVVAINLPDDPEHAALQPGCRSGSIGQPLPGCAVKIVDLETHETLPPGETGMMMVKGPSRMLGYLNRADLTEQAIEDGWYVTGDIARLDRDGFIFITDRLHRFSKIGGEMVPHVAIEDLVTAELGLVEPAVAVTAIPDERKGERLVLLYTAAVGSIDRLVSIIDQSELPNLWRPSRSLFIEVETLPMTPTGKLDIKGLRTIAIERTASPP